MKKSLLLILLSFCLVEASFSQNEAKDSVVEVQPKFPGGFGELSTFISNTMNYPSYAIENNLDGSKVYVQLLILETGEVSKVKVIRGVHPSLDNEAIRIAKAMPNWEPGSVNGEKVSCYYIIPIYLTPISGKRKKKKKKR